MGFSSSSTPIPILSPALAKALPKSAGLCRSLASPPPPLSPLQPPLRQANPPSVASAVTSPTTPEGAVAASSAAADVQAQLDSFKAHITHQMLTISAAVETLKNRADQTAADTGAKFDRILQLLSNPSPSSSSSSSVRPADRASDRSRSRGEDKKMMQKGEKKEADADQEPS